MTTPDPPWEPRPAFPHLLALATEMRPDWDRTELRDAMTAAHNAGWSWRDVFREVARLAWAEEETPVTLRISARKPREAPRGRLDPELKAAVLADLARRTGPQPRLTEINDTRESA